VKEYKYLGIPLDQALTLKHLVPLIKKKTTNFIRRINFFLQNILGTNAKFNLWQIYARCNFDYFAPAIELCGQRDKFERYFIDPSSERWTSHCRHLTRGR
jgi:hypothetical protein